MSDLAVVVTSSQENWYEGIRRFRMGHLDEFIETCGHDEAAVLSEVKQIENDDKAMSLLLLKTSHDGVICWKSSRYKTLKDFGNGLQNSLPEIMPEISEMQEAGMVDSIVDYFDLKSKIQALTMFGSPFKNTINLAYIFSNETRFNYCDKQFNTLDDLVLELSSQDRVHTQAHKMNDGYPIITEINELMKKEYFQVWIEALKRKNRG